MITKKQIENNTVTHRHAGNGWGVLLDIDKDWCQCVSALGNVGNVVYLVSKSVIEVGTEISPDVLKNLNVLRGQILSGSHIVKNNHVVPA